MIDLFSNQKINQTKNSRLSTNFSTIFSLILLLMSCFIFNLGPVSAYTTPYSACGNGAISPCQLPYFVVQGGDVYGSADFDDGVGNCDNQPGDFAYGSWNNNDLTGIFGVKSGFYGGAVQGANIVSDTAQEMASDVDSNAPFTTNLSTYQYTDSNKQAISPSYLGFANTFQYYNTYYTGQSNTSTSSYSEHLNYPANVTPYSTYALGQYPSYTSNFNAYGGDFGNGNKSGGTNPPSSSKPYGNGTALLCVPDAYGNNIKSSHTDLTTNPNLKTVGTGNNLNTPVSGTTHIYSIDLSTLAAGNYSLGSAGNSESLIIKASSPLTKSITLSIYGNAYIDSNITYCYPGQPCGTVSNTSGNIPQFQLSVEGDNGWLSGANYETADGFKAGYTAAGSIFVDGGVSEIHGFYTVQSAIPNPYSKDETGMIWSCAQLVTSNGLPSLPDYIEPRDDYANCDKQLRIYGSAEAGYYSLSRSYGNLNSMSLTDQNPNSPSLGKITNESNAAEVFQYTPELWIPDASSSGCSASCIQNSYSAEVSLPPVL